MLPFAFEHYEFQVIDSNKLYISNYCYVYNKKYFNNITNINEIPFILPVNHTQERIIINEYFTKNNITPNIKYEIENTDRMLSYIKNGFGIGIMLKDAIKESDNLSYTNIDIKSNICKKKNLLHLQKSS